MIVDGAKKRFGLYKRPASNGDQAELTTNEISGNVTIRGTGQENRVCPQTYTFALSVSSLYEYPYKNHKVRYYNYKKFQILSAA